MNTHARATHRIRGNRQNPLPFRTSIPGMDSVKRGLRPKAPQRKTVGRMVTPKPPRVFVPHENRKQVIAAFRQKSRQLGLRGKHTYQQLIDKGFTPPLPEDVNASKTYEAYAALCKASKIQEGSPVGDQILRRAIREVSRTGMTKSQLDAEAAAKGIQGDAKEAFWESEAFITGNPKSRFFNTPYPVRLRAAALVALNKIPDNNQPIQEVLAQYDARNAPQPKPLPKPLPEPQPEPEESVTSEVAGNEKQEEKSNTLMYVGITVGVLAALGVTYFALNRNK